MGILPSCACQTQDAVIAIPANNGRRCKRKLNVVWGSIADQHSHEQTPPLTILTSRQSSITIPAKTQKRSDMKVACRFHAWINAKPLTSFRFLILKMCFLVGAHAFARSTLNRRPRDQTDRGFNTARRL